MDENELDTRVSPLEWAAIASALAGLGITVVRRRDAAWLDGFWVSMLLAGSAAVAAQWWGRMAALHAGQAAPTGGDNRG